MNLIFQYYFIDKYEYIKIHVCAFYKTKHTHTQTHKLQYTQAHTLTHKHTLINICILKFYLLIATAANNLTTATATTTTTATYVTAAASTTSYTNIITVNTTASNPTILVIAKQ